jgi:predicted nuclease of predicted toxin-antitoxin system
MAIKLLIDMNLSPDWVAVFGRHGWHAVHWSSIGNPKASDKTIMEWAIANGFIVFTHDLDFGTAVALTHASGPSILQIRAEDVLPMHMETVVIAAIRQHESDLVSGAIVVVDERTSRVRILPI